MTDPVDAVLRYHDRVLARAKATFSYDIDPGDAFSAGLALQTRAQECRHIAWPRHEDDAEDAAGRRIAAALADVYDRVAAALMRPRVEVDATETPLGETIDAGAETDDDR